MTWTAADIPPQFGRLAIVTGATGGLGFEIAKALAAAGAKVVLAGRDSAKGVTAAREIGHGSVFEPLDLAKLASTVSFVERVSKLTPIDLLVNNAGLAAPPRRLETADGFELQFGTNFLGHFALSAGLKPYLAANARITTVSSLVEKTAKIDFDDLMSERRYSPTESYGQSKLANLIFARELQRRSDAQGWSLCSVAAHPGIAITELTKARKDQPVLLFNHLFNLVRPLIGHSAAKGALPILFAATAPNAEPGGYYGPQGFNEMRGPPGPAASNPVSMDPVVGARLWSEAERLTGLVF